MKQKETTAIPVPPVTVLYTVTIDMSTMQWELWVLGKQVVKNNSNILCNIPHSIQCDSLKELLSILDVSYACPGFPMDTATRILALQDDICRDILHSSTLLRARDCHMLLQQSAGHAKTLCDPCTSFKRKIQSKTSRSVGKNLAENSNTPAKTTPNVFLSTPQKLKKLASLAMEKEAATRKIRQLKDRISNLVSTSNISVSEELDEDLSEIMTAESEQIYNTFPKDSFQYMFWKEQVAAMSVTNPCQRRWNPLMIKWCLNLKMISSAAYHNLRTSGMLVLPSERTLRDYSNVVKGGNGFQMGILEQLYREACDHQDEIPFYRQFVGVVFDEVYIKSDLVFDRFSSQIIGFVNLGAVDQQLAALEHSTMIPEVATRVLTLMVRGIFYSMNFPLANFATNGVNAVQLFHILWEAVEHLERCDFRVVFQTADGSSPNRRYFRMHNDAKQLAETGVIHKAINIYSAVSSESNAIYFFSDMPHLLKTARNCLANTDAHAHSRHLWNGEDLSWKHMFLLEEACRQARVKSGGLSLTHKLTREHFHLTNFSKMKVNLAVQILSHSVATALKFYDIPGSQATQTFVANMNRFFDMLNVRSKNEGIHKMKEDLKPYESHSDCRLHWLENDFLQYLATWEENVEQRPGFKPAEKSLMLLSRETREGLRITIQSFVSLARQLLSDEGLHGKYLLSERFSQDPLEKFFGKIRQAGGRGNNPTVKLLQETTDILRLQSSSLLDVVRSESKLKKRLFPGGVDVTSTVAAIPLPKRKRVNT